MNSGKKRINNKASRRGQAQEAPPQKVMLSRIKLQIIFCFAVTLTYYMYAKWQIKFWEEVYFFGSKSEGLFFTLIIKGLIKDRKAKYGLNLLATLFGIRLAWEVLASISWTFANDPIVIFILFSLTVILICLHIFTPKKWIS